MNATGSVLLDTSVVVDYLRQQYPSLIRQLEGTNALYLPLTALGELLYGRLQIGRQNDIWIAATALEHNLPLVTRDSNFLQST